MSPTRKAAELAAAAGGPTAEFVADKGKLSTGFGWFADRKRLCVVADRAGADLERYDLALAHGLGHVGDRDLWLILPSAAARAAAERATFLDVPISVFAWDERGIRVERPPQPEEVRDRYRGTVRGGRHDLGDLASLLGPLTGWLSDRPELVPVIRPSYLAWHFHGRQVLEIRGSRRSGALSIVAGVKYSKAGPERPLPLTVRLEHPITEAEAATVMARIESAVEARRTGADAANAEHELQELLASRSDAIGLAEKPRREVPAVRPVKNGFIDLLGFDYVGRLRVIETKVGADDALVVQGLDYWIWASANAAALAADAGRAPPKEVVIDFVTAEKVPKGGVIGSYTAAQAEALDRSIRWRFITVRDWRDGDPTIEQLPDRVVPRDPGNQPAPRTTRPRWSVRLGDHASARAAATGATLIGDVFWPDVSHNLLPSALRAYASLEAADLVHSMIRHTRSSQAFALNLFAPLDAGALVAVARAAGVPAVAVEPPIFEWFDRHDRLSERSAASPHATQVDVFLRARDDEGGVHVLLVEVKLTEANFNGCSAWLATSNDRRDVCEADGPFGSNPEACFQLRNHDRNQRRRYDTVVGSLVPTPTAVPLVEGSGCWFRFGGNQPMRNAALARVLVEDGAAASATIALCAPLAHRTIWNRWDEAKSILAGAGVNFADLPAESVAAVHPDREVVVDRYLLGP